MLGIHISWRLDVQVGSDGTKLVDVVWVDIISMEIVHTGILPILSSIMEVLPIEMLSILTSMMDWVLGHFNLEFGKDQTDSAQE